MSTPGWYPDPAGTPDQYRYWDGRQWSQTTSPLTGGGPQGQSGNGPNRSRSGVIIVLVALLVVALALGAWQFFRPGAGRTAQEDTNSAAPTVSAWDETSRPTATPSATPSEPQPSANNWVNCPSGAARPRPYLAGDLRGGDIAVAPISGWRDGSASFGMAWVHDMQAQVDTVADGGGISWFSAIAVGAVSVVDGFEAPEQAAQLAMDCFATSNYYSGFAGRKDINQQEVTIDGHKGWWIRSEVYVKMAALPDIPGDVIDVVVIDTGSPESLSMFISSFTIGDSARGQKVDAARESLRVVG